MRGAIVATLILLSTGHVEGVGRDHWRSDHVHLEGGHQQGGGDGHQHPGLGENIDLRARARAAHRSGKCELLVLKCLGASCRQLVKLTVLGF